jgi:gluconate 2-dehydrogenase gamma chain
MAEDKIKRRDVLKSVGAAGTLAAASAAGTLARSPQAIAAEPAAVVPPAFEPKIWLTLNATEAAFIEAAVDTFIPADELTPSGSDCGVATFIDRQLAGAFGNGARLYRQGPFLKGKPQHGYQLSLTPHEFFAAGINATNEWSRATYGREFDRLSDEQRIEAMQALESGAPEFAPDMEGLSSEMFFDQLLQLTMEGFFADPIYGGNKDKAAWKMIGFPGLPASYREEISSFYNKKYDGEPQSIADFS